MIASKRSSDKMSGKNHWNWQGGKTPLALSFRKIWQYNQWREGIFERDNYTCQMCEKRGRRLNAHHIYKFSDFPELRLIKNNGITLCKECHDNIYGVEELYIEYFQEILKDKHGK